MNKVHLPILSIPLQPCLCAVSPSAPSVGAGWGWRFGSGPAACQQHTPRTSVPAFPPPRWRATCGHWGDCGSWNPRALLDVRLSSYIFLHTKNRPWRIKGKRYFLLFGLQTLETLLLHPHTITANGCLWAGSEMPSLWKCLGWYCKVSRNKTHSRSKP